MQKIMKARHMTDSQTSIGKSEKLRPKATEEPMTLSLSSTGRPIVAQALKLPTEVGDGGVIVTQEK